MAERHRALDKAVKFYGRNNVIKKLNAVRVLVRNTSPENSKIYTKDMKYIQNIKLKLK